MYFYKLQTFFNELKEIFAIFVPNSRRNSIEPGTVIAWAFAKIVTWQLKTREYIMISI